MLSKKSKANAILFKGEDGSACSQNSAFQKIASSVAKEMSISSKDVLASLTRREQANNTALVQGLAIPHIILKQHFSPWFFVFRSDNCLADWNCLDDSKVKLLICIVAPKMINQQDDNFRKIRQVINQLAEEKIVLQISKARTASQVIDILSN